MNSDVSVSFISMKLILLIDVPIPAMLPLTEDTQSPLSVVLLLATDTDIPVVIVCSAHSSLGRYEDLEFSY